MISLFYSCEFSWSICLSASKGLGNRFWSFFPISKGLENRFWGIFSVSATAKMHFFSFLSFRPWRKRCFCCFLLIRRGGKPIFSIFSLSAAAETLLLLFFFTLRPQPKADFHRFLSVVPLRKAVFAVFYWLYPYETRFFAFSARRRGTKGCFLRFQHFVGRRRAFFGGFCISKGLDSRFLNRIHVIM